MTYTRQIFVFGSNRQGRHGKGAALEAKLSHGAINGQPRGLQGSSYAIVTKELRVQEPPVDLDEIAMEVRLLLQLAKAHPEIRFNVTKLGCGLAGFRPEEIAPMFIDSPDNVYLPLAFIRVITNLMFERIYKLEQRQWDVATLNLE